MTQINLDTHEFGHRITTEHPFMGTAKPETISRLADEALDCPTVTEPPETDALIADLAEQLHNSRYDLKVLESSRNSWRALAMKYSSDLAEWEMSTWAKFKRWAKKQWEYDIYDDHSRG